MANALKVGSKGKEVKDLQTALNETPEKPKLKPDGQFGPTTEKAVKAFQKANKLKADGIAGKDTMQALSKGGGGKDAKGGNGKSGEENIGGLKLLNDVDRKLKEAVILFAEKYGGPITVTSGRRSLAKQAELMAPMNDKQLNMYGKGKAPYVVEIKKLEKRTAKEVEKILAKYWPSPCFISGHLSGKAVDISRSGLNTAKADKAAAEAGLQVFDDPAERSLNCYHVSLKKPSTKA